MLICLQLYIIQVVGCILNSVNRVVVSGMEFFKVEFYKKFSSKKHIRHGDACQYSGKFGY